MDWSRLRRVFHIGRFRADPRREVDQELQFHFEEAQRELEAEGLTPEDARREALRRFGNVDAYRRELERMEEQAARRWLGSWIATSSQAVSFALRRIRGNPGFTVAVVATLGLGLGANVAVFRVVDHLLLSPPEHVQDADRVVKLYVDRAMFGQRITMPGVSYPFFRDVRAAPLFEGVAAYSPRTGIIGSGPSTEEVTLGVVSSSFFSLLGVEPAAGRLIGPEDDRPGVAGTVVLSTEYWERSFGGDPDVIGRSLEIGDGRYTVVGIAPPGFTGAEIRPVDVWLPLQPYAAAAELADEPWRESRGVAWLRLVARLAPGASPEAAAEQATAVYRAGRQEFRESATDARVLTASLVPGDRPDPGDEIPVARWLMGLALVVLVVACANVANLFLARDLRRRRELAVRSALGIGRGRLIGHLMTEAGILAVLGGIVAMVLASFAGASLHQLLLPDLAVRATFTDTRVLVFAGLGVVFTTLVAGAIPAIHSSGPNLADSLKSGGNRTATTRTGIQAALLVAQAALSVVLLTAAAVFIGSLGNAVSVDLGFRAEGLTMVDLELQDELSPFAQGDGESTWPPTEDARLFEVAAERISDLPGVDGVALVNPTPFLQELVLRVRVPGVDSISRLPATGPFPLAVTANYFDVMEIEILTGRGIRPSDDAPGAAPVAVVSETMAEMIWPNESAIGTCIQVGGDDRPCTTVVGVAEDANRAAIVQEEPQMVFYVPIRRQILAGRPTAILMRGPGADAGAIRQAAESAAPRIRFARVQPFSEVLAPELRPWRLGATAFGAFGLLALAVASVGLYSVLSFEVAGRSRELGVRSALGARSPQLLKMIVGQAAVVIGTGIGLGLVLVILARPSLEPLLYQVDPLDPGIVLAVAGLLVSISLVATAVPAIRAMRVDPVEVLRTE